MSERTSGTVDDTGADTGADTDAGADSDTGTDTDSVTVRWSELLAEAVARFERAGIETAPLDARRVVEEITGVPASGMHRVLDDCVTTSAMARFDELAARREQGEPLQYVLGRWGFRTLDLMVDQRVLIPRPETETVAGLAIDAVNELRRRRGLRADKSSDPGDSDGCSAPVTGTASDLPSGPGDLGAPAGGPVVVADLGTGSGAIALSVAVECKGARVYATDISEQALAVARANLAGIGAAATAVSLHRGDWFEALPDHLQGSLDVVVSNPPYVAQSEGLPAVITDWEPATALWAGSQGFADLRTIVDQAPRWLAPHGVIVLEMSPPQTPVVRQWFIDLGWRAAIHADLNGRPRAVVACR